MKAGLSLRVGVSVVASVATAVATAVAASVAATVAILVSTFLTNKQNSSSKNPTQAVSRVPQVPLRFLTPCASMMFGTPVNYRVRQWLRTGPKPDLTQPPSNKHQRNGSSREKHQKQKKHAIFERELFFFFSLAPPRGLFAPHLWTLCSQPAHYPRL